MQYVLLYAFIILINLQLNLHMLLLFSNTSYTVLLYKSNHAIQSTLRIITVRKINPTKNLQDRKMSLFIIADSSDHSYCYRCYSDHPYCYCYYSVYLILNMSYQWFFLIITIFIQSILPILK